MSSHVGRVLERKEKKRKGRKTHTIEGETGLKKNKKRTREAVIFREKRSDQSG